MKAPSGHPLPIPRSWLFSLAALLILPWAVVLYLYVRAGQTPVAEPEAAAQTSAGAPGRWGRLSITPILISPPAEYVSTDTWPADPPAWTFPQSSIDEVVAFLDASGLPAAEVARLRATAVTDPRIPAIVLKPPIDLVAGLSPDVRARIYLKLGQSSLNFAQAQAFRFESATLDGWLKDAAIQPETRRLAEPFFYRGGGLLYFADLGLLKPQIANSEEYRRLTKTLYRQPTMLVELSLAPGDDVAAIAQYWGKGGRRTDVRPLLDSIADSGARTDIVHLLPAFARDHLYRYPRVTTADFDRPTLANCLWSSLNFFSSVPDDRLLEPNVAISRLKTEFYVVETDFELGDIVAFVDEQDNLFHVAVYLADGFLFSKNGLSVMAPWTITTIDSVKAYYATRSPHPRVIVHRRNES